MQAPANHIRRLALIAAAASVLLAAPAAAAPDWVSIEVPAGWQRSEPRSQAIAEHERARDPFAGEARVQVDSHQAPEGGAALHLVSLEGPAGEPPGLVARRQLDMLRAAPEDASLSPGQTTLVSWDETLAGDVAVATIEWRHDQNETITLARTLVWADTTGAPRQVTAECVMRADAAAAARPPCEAALASLALAPAAGPRGPLTTLAKQAGEPPRRKVRSGPSLQPAGEHVTRDSAVVVSQQGPERDSSSRWLYILGAAALVLAFYLTTRGRNDRSGDDRVEVNVEAEDQAEVEVTVRSDSDDDAGAEDDDAPEDEDEDEDEKS